MLFFNLEKYLKKYITGIKVLAIENESVHVFSFF